MRGRGQPEMGYGRDPANRRIKDNGTRFPLLGEQVKTRTEGPQEGRWCWILTGVTGVNSCLSPLTGGAGNAQWSEPMSTVRAWSLGGGCPIVMRMPMLQRRHSGVRGSGGTGPRSAGPQPAPQPLGGRGIRKAASSRRPAEPSDWSPSPTERGECGGQAEGKGVCVGLGCGDKDPCAAALRAERGSTGPGGHPALPGSAQGRGLAPWWWTPPLVPLQAPVCAALLPSCGHHGTLT